MFMERDLMHRGMDMDPEDLFMMREMEMRRRRHHMMDDDDEDDDFMPMMAMRRQMMKEMRPKRKQGFVHGLLLLAVLLQFSHSSEIPF